MLRRIDLRGTTDFSSRIPRPRPESDMPVESVRAIVAAVRDGGDAALVELTARYDGVGIGGIRVDPGDIHASKERVPPELLAALEAARDQVDAFYRHRARATGTAASRDGEFCREGIGVTTVRVPVRRAGLYVPGGRARYPSTVLMTAVPARVAGVDEIALCVPPGPDGQPPDATLAAAAVAGVDEVYRVGGAQAIAAMAYGTESLARVDVIAGPGNVYVSLAKREVSGVVGTPGAFAGPSEVVVVADAEARCDLVAVDLLVQAEHGPDGLTWLVAWSPEVVEEVCAEIEKLLRTAARRADIEATLASGGYAAIVDSPDAAIALANLIAPEHLELMCADAATLAGSVRNAGAVFIGELSGASFGDYVAGPSHVLPTNGTARFAGALRLEDFQKEMSIVSVRESGVEQMGPSVRVIAEAEGLQLHGDSARLRA